MSGRLASYRVYVDIMVIRVYMRMLNKRIAPFKLKLKSNVYIQDFVTQFAYEIVQVFDWNIGIQ